VARDSPAAEARPSPAGEVRDIQRVIAALASPTRREILALIWEREVPAGEIAAAFALTKPTISQHLAVLRQAGLVTARAAGTSRRYRARQEALRGLHAALGSPGKWSNADDAPERALAGAHTAHVVIASTDVVTSQAATFAAFTDPAMYSRWLGVPVSIEGGRFACTMEWGTHVRGWYELVCPPELIVMRWDFEDDNIPVPGGEMTGYLRIRPRGQGSHVEVHQLAGTAAEARFMEAAWRTVLGRLQAGVAAAVSQQVAPARRFRRPKVRGAPPLAR
jgi:DNA-binding transcriptional ArsR family regulator